MDTVDIVKNTVYYQLGCNKDIITFELNSKLREDLFLDSLDLTEIALLIEEDLKIILPDKALPTCETIDDLCDLVKRHLPEGGPYENK